MQKFTIERGKKRGIVLTPHRYSNGLYFASKAKFGQHRWVSREEDLESRIEHGWSIRLSNQDSFCHRAPSLISPGSVVGENAP